jgi:hypothetical protein
MHVTLVSPPKARLHYRELRLRRSAAPESAGTSGNTTVVPALPAPADVAVTDNEEAPKGNTMPPGSQAAEAGWKPPASPDHHEDEPQADTHAPASDKPAKPEPETENKFE